MLKTALANALKRHWGLVAAIVMITTVSTYRQQGQVSLAASLHAGLLALLALLVIAVPLERHRLRKRG